jgi:ribosomal protein S18 acetylase RimI-like enzyme
VEIVSPVRRGIKSDASVIAQRVAEQLLRDARVEPLVSSDFSRQEFETALTTLSSPLWVDDSNGHIRGHLYGATFDDPLFGRQTWTGPDGYSFEFEDALDNLREWAYGTWREEGSTAHLVWALAGHGTQTWIERGYQVVSVRGALALSLADIDEVTWPPGHAVRRADISDLETAAAFDAFIDLAQDVPIDSFSDLQREASRADLRELLEDPECNYYLLEVDGQPAAQCVTFPLPPLRGNFDNTLYVGSLAVDPSFRRRGLGRTLTQRVLNDALRDGFEFAEVRWHINNSAATSFWSAMGFRPTYVQLRYALEV